MADAPEKPHRRWYRLTPERCVVALLALEGLLWLSERFRWFAFNQHKGWTVLICLATVGAAFVLMFLWFLSALIFRWRFQFSIRSLFVLTVVVAIPSAWLATEMKAARKQRETVEEIERAGGQAAYDDGQNYPCDVSLTYIVPPCAVAVPNPPAVASYHPARATSPSAPGPYNAPPAGALYIPCSPTYISPPVPPEPTFLRRLLGDEMFVSVREVEFPDSEAGDAEIETLKGLTRLQDLRLNNTKVSDAGLKHLKGLGQLQALYLFSTKVGDAGLENLRGLTRLRRLDLGGTKVSDAGLPHLKGLTQLREIGLGGTNVTDAGVKGLKKALPNVNIIQ